MIPLAVNIEEILHDRTVLRAALVVPIAPAQQPLVQMTGVDPDWDEIGVENHQPQLTPATGAR